MARQCRCRITVKSNLIQRNTSLNLRLNPIHQIVGLFLNFFSVVIASLVFRSHKDCNYANMAPIFTWDTFTWHTHNHITTYLIYNFILSNVCGSRLKCVFKVSERLCRLVAFRCRSSTFFGIRLNWIIDIRYILRILSVLVSVYWNAINLVGTKELTSSHTPHISYYESTLIYHFSSMFRSYCCYY